MCLKLATLKAIPISTLLHEFANSGAWFCQRLVFRVRFPPIDRCPHARRLVHVACICLSFACVALALIVPFLKRLTLP